MMTESPSLLLQLQLLLFTLSNTMANQQSITSSPKTSEKDMETPGFRFNPTEEQLLNYFLRHKICGNDSKVSAIAEIDRICNYEPWDLPRLAAIPSKDTWHFFSLPDRKNRKSGNNNRVTKAGYWKVTGKKREIRNKGKNQVIGIKRILVFYEGRVRDPVWTNWTMHEYQLNNSYSNGRNYVISRLHKRTPKGTVNSAVEPGHDAAFEVENHVTDITFPEIDPPQFMGKFLDSNDQDVTYLTAQQPEWHCSQGPSNVHLQHTNGVTDDYTMPLSEMDPRFMVDFLDSNEQDATFPTTQHLELLCSQGPSNVDLQHTNGVTDDYTMPLSEMDSRFMVDFLDTNAQDVTFPTTQQPEFRCSQGPSNVFLQHNNGVTETMPSSDVDPQFMVEFLDPNYQDVTSHTAQWPELLCSQGPSNVSLQHTNGVTDDYTMPSFEIDPQFLLEFLDSNKQDVTFPTTRQPELHCSQDPSNLFLQHANDLTDDTMPSSQFGSGYLQDNNIEAVKLHPAIQDLQYHIGSMHTALDDSSPSESLVNLDIGDINDTEAIQATTLQGLSYENLQKTNNVVDECNLLSSQFVANGQQDKISEMVSSYPPIPDVHFYCGSTRISPRYSSPSESSASVHVKNISNTEAINTAPEGSSDSVWDRWFEHDSAYFSSCYVTDWPPNR